MNTFDRLGAKEYGRWRVWSDFEKDYWERKWHPENRRKTVMNEKTNIHDLASAFEGDYEVPAVIKDEFSSIINRHSIDNALNMPDFIIAEYLVSCLQSLAFTLKKNADWRSPPILPK